MRGLKSSIGVNLLTTLLAVASGIILARTLGPTGRGEVTQLMYWPQFFYGLAHLSVGEAMILLSTPNRSTTNLRETAIKCGLSVSIPAAVITIAWLVISGTHDTVEYRRLSIVYAAAYLPGMIIFGYLTSLLQGEDKHLEANGLRAVLAGTYTLALVVIHSSTGLTPGFAVYSSILSILVATLAANWLTKKWQTSKVAEEMQIGKVLKTSIPLHITTALNSLNTQFDRLCAVLFYDTQYLGQYIVACTIASSVAGVIAQTIYGIAFPRISQAKGKGEAFLAAKQSIIYTLAMSSAVAILLFAATPILTKLAFGGDFSEAIPIARTLSIAWVLVATRQVASRIAKAIGANTHNIAIEATYSIGFGIVCAGYYITGSIPPLPEIFLAFNLVAALIQIFSIFGRTKPTEDLGGQP